MLERSLGTVVAHIMVVAAASGAGLLLPCAVAQVPASATTLRADADDPYGGPPPGAPAIRFAPATLPAGRAFAAAFTPDARTLFFTYSDRAQRVVELWTSRFEQGRWSTPEPAPFARGHRAADPFVSPDGLALYFSWAKPRPGMPTDSAADFDTWVVTRRAGGSWSEPRHVGGSPSSPQADMYPAVTRDGTLYFDSTRPGLAANRNVWRAPRAGTGYGPAEPLPSAVNDTTAGASNPYVDPDERYVIFSSGRGGGGTTNADLWIAYRQADGTWGEPMNLGSRVNTADTEFCPTVSPDGRWLLFSRIRYENGRPAADDVFIVSIDVLPPAP